MKEKKKKRFHTREFGGVPQSTFWLIASGKTLWFFTSLASAEILSALHGVQRKVNHGMFNQRDWFMPLNRNEQWKASHFKISSVQQASLRF